MGRSTCFYATIFTLIFAVKGIKSMKTYIAVILSVLVILAGCSSNKDERSSVVERSSDPLFLEDQILTGFPVILKSHNEYGSVEALFEKNKTKLDALAKAGLLFVKESTDSKVYKGKGLNVGRDRKVDVITKEYDLTALGIGCYTKQGFRFGSQKVVEIILMEEPVQVQDRLVSDIQFLYQAVDVYDWVKGFPVTLFPLSRLSLESIKKPVKKRMTLIKTDQGWMDIRKVDNG